MRISIFLLSILTAGTALAKDMIPTPPDFPVIGQLEQRLYEEMVKKPGREEANLATVNTQAFFKAVIEEHGLKLFGGPQLGCVTDTSAKVWVRTPYAATVHLQCGETKSPSITTSSKNDFTAILDLKGLKANTSYTYQVFVNDEPALAKPPSFKTAPAAGGGGRFSIAFGGGARYNHPKEYMWETMASFNPAATLLLGDNLYIDNGNHRGMQRMYYYRRQLRPEYQTLSATSAMYSIWDDHDFHNNDSAGGLHPTKPDYKIPVWKVFQENWVNPGYGEPPENPGCYYSFNIGDVDFFMTDGRYYRDFKKDTMLGPVQKKWLINALKQSTATFKVICSGTLWTEHADKGGKDSWWGVREEREEVLSTIDKHNLGGVLLLSADRHRTDVYELHRPNGYTLYEFETSKLTNDHTHPTKPKALFSYNKGNYFGLIDFDLDKKAPQFTFKCITIDREEVYALTIKRSQLEKGPSVNA